ncbi:metalloregulator ArsR/SmtB family transcription factor [Christensenellaceae bacterium OttesenSCG-928-K19]|nr:metalloregulator ArsR/SmtB family transcription factor [Christensenellaceae bacterium OttesenSCG-928-K19]
MSTEKLPMVAGIFKILGDETRIRLLWVLMNGEKCVVDLAKAIGMSESAVSHQLKELRLAGLVSPKRDGKRIYYSLKSNSVRKVILNIYDALDTVY